MENNVRVRSTKPDSGGMSRVPAGGSLSGLRWLRGRGAIMSKFTRSIAVLASVMECAALTAGATAAPATSASCSQLFQGSAHAVFNHLLQAHLRPAPLWPTYLPPGSTHAHWSVYGIRGVPLYPGIPPDRETSGPTAYSVNFGVNPSFCSGGARRGAGFSRTSSQAFQKDLRASGLNGFAPQDVQLGGRNVIEFRPYSSETYWGFLRSGSAYLFYSKDFGGPPSSVIGKMIASLRPITRLRPPA